MGTAIKIATEEDYWMCSGGIMPAQMQTTQLMVRQKDDVKYLTTNDLATSPNADFMCAKMVLLMAAIAVFVVALTVLTGGAGLAALAAASAVLAEAMVVGAMFGALLGSLICGQKAAIARSWIGGKKDFLILGQATVTTDMSITCPIFGATIKYAPKIKSFWDALAVGFTNFAINAVIGGVLGLLAAEAWLVIGEVGFINTLYSSMLNPFSTAVANFASTFTGQFLGVRLLSGIQSGSYEYYTGGDSEKIAGATADSFIPEIGMGERILNGTAQPMDYLLFAYFIKFAPGGKSGGSKSPVQEEAVAGQTAKKPTTGESPVQPKVEPEPVNAPGDEAAGTKGADGKAWAKGGAKSMKQQVEASRDAYRKSIENHGKLPESQEGKTTAKDGINTVSGSSPKRISNKTRKDMGGVTDVPPKQVIDRSGKIGHKLKENSSIDNGVPGQASASHAEKQIMTAKPGDPIGVSRKMCKCCREFAQKHANDIGEPVVITDPEGTKIFSPGKAKPRDIGWK